MPAYSFKGQFVPYVENGTKPHTIRNRRKYPTKVGDKLYLYFGLRTKWSKKLREEICTAVKSIAIAENGIVIYQRFLDDREMEIVRRQPSTRDMPIDEIMVPGHLLDAFAWKDGFRPAGTTLDSPIGAFDLMCRFWKQTHDLPWVGDIIYWQPNIER